MSRRYLEALSKTATNQDVYEHTAKDLVGKELGFKVQGSGLMV